MMTRHCKLMGSLICLLIGLGSARAPAQSVLMSEKTLESYVREVLSDQIKEDLYFVDVAVNRQDTDQATSTSATDAALPYTTLKTDLEYLKKNIDRTIDTDVLNLNYQITVVVDESVPDETLNLVQQKIERRFGIDGTARTLDMRKAQILPNKPVENVSNEAEKIALERSKLENQKTQIQLEREKLAAAQRETDLKNAVQKAEEEANKAKESAAEEIEKLKNQMEAEPVQADAPEKSVLDILKDFQFIIIAVIVAAILGFTSMFGAGSQRKGLTALSSAIKAIGENIVAKDAPAAEAPVASPQADTPPDSLPALTSTDRSQEVTGEASDEKYLEFLKLVEEKVEILSQQGNYNFYRHFLDMIAKDPKSAASILVSVKAETAQKLASNLAPFHMQKIKDFLSEPGSLEVAQKARRQALQSFYGLIAIDEYIGSPLTHVNDAHWIAQLDTAALIDLTVAMEQDDRPIFLACFTPSRLALMVQEADPNKKQILIASIKDVDSANSSEAIRVIDKARNKHREMAESQKEKVRSLIDGPQFYAKIIHDLSPENRSSFLDVLRHKHELYDQIKNYYVPFDTIKMVSTPIIKEIFAKRPTAQLAKILLTCDEEIRSRVIGVVPEALQDTVREELETLEANEASRKKNDQESWGLQDEISKYLLSLNKEGMLEYESEQPVAQSSDSAA